MNYYILSIDCRTNLISLDNAAAKIGLLGQEGQGGMTSSRASPHPDVSVPQVEVIESVSTMTHRTRSGSGTSEVEAEGGEEGKRILRGPVPAFKGQYMSQSVDFLRAISIPCVMFIQPTGHILLVCSCHLLELPLPLYMSDSLISCIQCPPLQFS